MILENHLGRFVIDEAEALEFANLWIGTVGVTTHIAFWYPTEVLVAKLKSSRPTFEGYIIIQYKDADPVKAAQTILENS